MSGEEKENKKESRRVRYVHLFPNMNVNFIYCKHTSIKKGKNLLFFSPLKHKDEHEGEKQPHSGRIQCLLGDMEK